MNVKVLVVVLVALVVAGGLVLFYGGMRPGATADGSRGGVDGALGWLTSQRTLTVADLDGPCVDAVGASIDVPALGVCVVGLPGSSRIALCLDDPASVTVSTDGADYPVQRVDDGRLACADPDPVPVYDTDTMLTVACVVAVPCTVRVIPPG